MIKSEGNLTRKDLESKEYPKRTGQQNKAMHVLFNLYAGKLNESGLDMRRTLKETIDIPWTGQSVKEYIWKPIQKALLQKESTTELTTVEIDEVFETINRFMGERHGLTVRFPSIEEIIWEQRQYAEEQKIQKQKEKDAHLAHCYQGDYAGSCKYGEQNCPALKVSNRRK